MTDEFCTYFDHRYAAKGLAMWRSLKKRRASASLHVLCLNEACREILAALRLPDVHLHSLDVLEGADPDLLRARGNRSLVEYYFTLTPCLPLYIFRTHPEVLRLTYVDADLFFFADPRPILDEVGDNAVGLIEHRFPDELAGLEKHGRFNVGWLTFRNDPIALNCLETWREQCIEWCYDRAEPGRFAEQKYLDDWPDRFRRIQIIQHRGANVAPWNLNRFAITLHGDELRVGGQPMLFFHAHGFESASPGRPRALNLKSYRVEETPLLLGSIFEPYEEALVDATREIATSLALLSDQPRGAALLRERPGASEGPPTSHSVNAIHSPSAAPIPAFRGWIDAPAGGKSPSTHFVVRGWCYHRQGTPITRVRVRIGARMFPGVYGVKRPDVYAAFDGESGSEHSGYEIPVRLASSSATCELQAQLLDGSWQVVQSLVVHVPGGTGRFDRIKWAWFWCNAWLGRPDTWAHLTEAERDFAVAGTRLRGWFNLEVTPQHSPRPLISEQFPSTGPPIERLPRIAAVTPSLQQGSFLEQTIRSVLDQRDVQIDYIVQDGGSTDGTVDLIRRYAPRLTHWESARDGGQAAAIVRGFSKVELRPDDLMMYLNSDDILLDGAGRFVAEYFARHPQVDVVYGHRVLMDDKGQEVGRWITPRPACNDLRLFDFVPQETLFWRKRIWDRVGGIDTSFNFALDWDLLLRFTAAGAHIARLPWFLGAFRLHSQQKTNHRMQEDGIPEMNALRQRTFGRMPTHDELHLAARRAELDSALVYALFQRGWRV